MTASISLEFVGILIVSVFAAGALNGIAGFGFAIIGTMALATMIDPATAVVIMIIPILSVNLSLVRELSTTEIRTCGRRFGPLILAALVGTVIGLVVLDRIPTAPLRIGLGVLSLAFVASVQEAIRIPGLEKVKAGCFVETPLAMVGFGSVSGVVFGGSNVGVQLIAYLRSRNLSHSLFIGVIAMVFLGLNGIRVGAAALLGLYPNSTLALLSVGAAVPAVAGVAGGTRLRDTVSGRSRRVLVLGLLTLIGIRLLLSGLGVG